MRSFLSLRPGILTLACTLLFATALGGCSSVFGIRPPIPTILQGNIYEQEDLEKLQTGMTESQVLYILGTPLLRPLHQPNEWYYYRSAVRKNLTLLRRLLVLRFDTSSKLLDWEIRHTADVPDDFTAAARTLHISQPADDEDDEADADDADDADDDNDEDNDDDDEDNDADDDEDNDN